MKNPCIYNTLKNYENDTIFNYLRSILLLLCMLTGITSCNKDEEDRKNDYLTTVFVNILTRDNISIDPNHQDWKVEIDNPEIIDVTMDEHDLNIIPKKLGTTRLLVLDGNKKELFKMNVDILTASRWYRIDSLSTIVEVANESYKEIIEKEMETLYPHSIGTTYKLIYYTKNDGKLIVQPNADGNWIDEDGNSMKGTFLEEDNESIFFSYNGSEQRYSTNIAVDENQPQLVYEGEDIYFIKDYTLYFKDKYPEAGVSRVNGKQITKRSYPPTVCF